MSAEAAYCTKLFGVFVNHFGSAILESIGSGHYIIYEDQPQFQSQKTVCSISRGPLELQP